MNLLINASMVLGLEGTWYVYVRCLLRILVMANVEAYEPDLN